MKHKVSAMIAFAVLACAIGVGIWAINTGANGAPSAKAGDGSVTTEQPVSQPTATTPAQVTQVAGVKIPKRLVNPLGGASYCATVRLLGVYAHQPYGLDDKLQAVDGRKFDVRLKTVAATYQRLAAQSRSEPKVGNVAGHWETLSRAASTAERKLRVAGLEVKSQNMMLPFAELAKTTHAELPKAAATIPSACGLPLALLGL